MKENFKLGGILLTITMIAGLLLGFANTLTKESILENSKISKEDLAYIMPEAEKIKDSNVELDEGGNIKEVYEALKDEEIIGYVLKVTSKGFHGPIDFVVGISKEDKVSGVKVLAHSETPGLGEKISKDSYISRFKGKPATGYLEVVKATPNKDTEVEAVSGATVSSKASVTAVNEAITFYLEKIKGETIKKGENTDSNTGASEKEEKTNVNTGASLKEENTDSNTGASTREESDE